MPVQFDFKIMFIGMISGPPPSPIKFHTANIFLLAIQVFVGGWDNSYCFFFREQTWNSGKILFLVVSLVTLFVVVFFYAQQLKVQWWCYLWSMDIISLVMHISKSYYCYYNYKWSVAILQCWLEVAVLVNNVWVEVALRGPITVQFVKHIQYKQCALLVD